MEQAIVDNTIGFKFTYTGDISSEGAWFGIVLGQESMVDGDMVICLTLSDSGSPGCGDFYSATNNSPDDDTNSNVSTSDALNEDGTLTVVAS